MTPASHLVLSQRGPRRRVRFEEVFSPVPLSAFSRIQVIELSGFGLEGTRFLARPYFFRLGRRIGFAFSTLLRYCVSGFPLTVTDTSVPGFLS